MKRIFIFFTFILLWLNAEALSLAGIFGEDMVLQQGNETVIWGTSKPGSSVIVKFRGQKYYKALTNPDGLWELKINAGKPGGPFELEVKSGNDSIKLTKIFVGDVWLAGGQSNMYFKLKNQLNADKYIEQSIGQNIRYACITVSTSDRPFAGQVDWQKITPDNSKWTSAVAYFFVRELGKHINYPIGIISCNRGSASAESWISEDRMKNDSRLKVFYDKHVAIANSYPKGEYEQKYAEHKKKMEEYNASLKNGTPIRWPSEPMGYNHPEFSSGLYKAMLSSIVPTTLKGVIWYQGEANAKDWEGYRTIFPALIEDWRCLFRNKDLPFYFVQLSNFHEPRLHEETWARLREVQYEVSQTVKNTGMVISIDYGEKKDIHPRNKKPVGKRLAHLALNKTYGMKIADEGPAYKKMKKKGNCIILTFNNTYGGLKIEGEELNGFTVCGKDSVFYKATAKITGKNKITISSPDVHQPKEVRYRFSGWSDGNLYNKENLPCIPFRTDRFEIKK